MLRIAVAAVVIGLTQAASSEKNCTVDGLISCYTCLGRDLSNCFTGQTCCKGACFKLIDEDHDVIIKGCSVVDEEDGSMKRRELNVQLYWANKEKVKGESYFCTGSDYCNSISTTLTPMSFLVLCLRYFL